MGADFADQNIGETVQMFTSRLNWYLIKTSPRKEQWVCEQLSGLGVELFSPLHQTEQKHRRRKVSALQPLFPTYVFAECDLTDHLFAVTHTPGVRGFVSAGREPLIVPQAVIAELQRRCPGGVAEIKQPHLKRGQPVEIVSGPLRGLSGVFDHYRSAGQRVIIMLDLIRSGAVRVALRASEIGFLLYIAAFVTQNGLGETIV